MNCQKATEYNWYLEHDTDTSFCLIQARLENIQLIKHKNLKSTSILFPKRKRYFFWGFLTLNLWIHVYTYPKSISTPDYHLWNLEPAFKKTSKQVNNRNQREELTSLTICLKKKNCKKLIKCEIITCNIVTPLK